MTTRTITLRYDSTCALCGCKMAAGSSALWQPRAKWSHGATRHMTTSGVLEDGTPITSCLSSRKDARFVGIVTHPPEAGCGSEYRVKAIYDCTSKVMVVKAYEAEMALRVVTRALKCYDADGRVRSPKSGVAVPQQIVVYQGDVQVLSQMVRSA